MVNPYLFDGFTFYVFPTGRDKQVYDLVDLVEEHGGAIVDLHKERIDDIKLDELADGIALIDPSQLWAPEYFKKRKTSNPDTNATIRFINWGFPNLCVEEDEIVNLGLARKRLTLTQTARTAGGWSIYFSGSIRDDDAKLKENMNKVTKCGGRLARNERSATILIVVDEDLDEARVLYEDNALTRVESKGWLLDSIRSKYVKFTPPPRKPMPGRIPISEGGKRRVDFTEGDKETLVRFLALHANTRGLGRSGDNIYKSLCEKHPELKDRHPWHSWQNQYKKNKKRYDALIESYIQENLPFFDEQGRDPRLRSKKRSRPGTKRPTDKRAAEGSGEENKIEAEAEEPTRKPPVKRRRVERRAESEEEEIEDNDIAEEDGENLGPQIEDTGPEEFNAFDEEIERMPRSTPPRAVQPMFDVSRSTLVGNTSEKPRAPPTQERELTPVQMERISLYGSLFGLALPSDSEDDSDSGGVDQDVGDRLPPPSSMVEMSSNRSTNGEQEESIESTRLPHLDMVEVRRQRNGISANATRRSSHAQVTQEEGGNEEDELPARTFEVSGSLRKSSSSFPEDRASIYTPRSQRQTQRAVRASGIFPAFKRSDRSTKAS